MGCTSSVQAKDNADKTMFQKRFAPGKNADEMTLVADLKIDPNDKRTLKDCHDDKVIGAVNSSSDESKSGNAWKPVKVLGIGGFGTVTLVKNKLGEHAAVKTLEFKHNDPNVHAALQLLKREIRVLRLADHPNIVKYYKSTRTKNAVHMFMEYCPGGSIKAKYSSQGPIDMVNAKRYLQDILSGLAFLHEKDIIHRDIKGDNVLLGLKDDAKLADFGAAVDLSELSQVTRIGTFFWMAPEVLTGEGHRWEADIWSVGCTLIEMLTARRPFSWCCVVQSQLLTTLTDVHSLTPPLPPSITDELCLDFVRLCLAKARILRPPVSVLQKHKFLTGA